MTTWYTNADFLTNKIEEFKRRVLTSEPSIVSVVETGFKENPLSKNYFPSETLSIEGYQMFRQDNHTEVKGGILVYVKDGIDASKPNIKKLTNLSSETKESLWLQIKLGDQKMLYGTIYRKGSSGFTNNSKILEMINIANEHCDNLLVCGDFNFPKICWKTNSVEASTYSPEIRFMNCLEDNYLTQHVLEPTRRRGKDNPSTIDMIITKNDQARVEPDHEPPLGKGDHDVLIWKYLLSVNEDNVAEEDKITKKNYYKADMISIKESLKKIDWNDLLLNGETDPSKVNLDDVVDTFYKEVHKIIDKNVPDCPNSKKKKELWWNKKTMKSMKKKYHCWKRYQETKRYGLYLSYCKQRNKTAKIIRQAKRDFELKIAKEAKCNPKAFYKYCNSQNGKKSHVIRLKDEFGKTLLSDKDNANLLNKYFCSVFTSEDDNSELILNSAIPALFNEDIDDPFNCNIKTPTKHLDDIIGLSIDDVIKHLKDLDTNKSNVPSCIHPKVLKEAADELAQPVFQIFRISLAQGKVPCAWKTGIVTPIHKGEDRHTASNYRPITITSSLCRVLEKIIKLKIVDHLAVNSLLIKDQHGFITGKSCLTNLLHTMEDLLYHFDNGEVIDEIFLDFAKAFDKVPHQRLLFKLKKYGITGTLLTWIESFLTSRKQAVRIKNSVSGIGKVTSGVPQGSVLGPILFLIFINDLPLNITSTAKLFADDTKLYRIIRSINDADMLQQDLNTLVEWCKEWKMVFNITKCHVLHISKKNPQYLYHMDGRLLACSLDTKDLGVTVSNDLKPHSHINNIVKKANQTLGMIKRSFTNINKDIFLLTYKTFIRPGLEYCQSVWSPHLQKDIDLLERVQRRATKMVTGLKDIPYEERLKKLDLFSLEHRRHRGDMILVYKMAHNLVNIDCNDVIKFKKHTNNRGHSWKLDWKFTPKTDLGRNTFSERVIIPWNKLPESVVNSTDVLSFKRNYDNYIKSKNI